MKSPLAPLLILTVATLAAPAALSAQDTQQQEGQATTPAETQPATPPPARTQPAPPPAPKARPEPAQPEPAPVAEPAQEPATEKKKVEKEEQRPVARAAAPGSVTIKDFDFGPASVTVNVGESVTWTNSGPSGHTATASDGSFDTGLLAKGKSGSHTFTEPGTFSYICTPHPSMKGTVRVVGSSSGWGGGSEEGEDSAGAGASESPGTTPSEPDDGPTLPNSGSETGFIAGIGACFLVLGLSLRRRTRGQAA